MVYWITTFLLCTIVVLTSCDPGIYLIVKNPNKDNSTVTVYAKKSYQKRFTQNKTTFYFGIGEWDDTTIANISENIDSIIIKNNFDCEVLKEKIDIQNYLIKHRKRSTESVLKIK